MERFLRNVDIWCWRYLENTRNYPGVNLTATTEGCDALLRVLELIEKEGPGSKRTIPLRQLRPEDEAKVSGGQRYRDFKRLRLCLVDSTPDFRQLCVSYDNDTVTVETVSQKLDLLRESVAEVRRGFGDFGIGPDTTRKEISGPRDEASETLMFWPCFGHWQRVP